MWVGLGYNDVNLWLKQVENIRLCLFRLCDVDIYIKFYSSLHPASYPKKQKGGILFRQAGIKTREIKLQMA